MEKISFDKILFRSAFSVMACDGEIHRDEISAFKNISTKNPYFSDIDFETEMKSAVDELKSKGINYITEFFEILKRSNFKEKQKLLLIEIILKIIDADNKVDDNELSFLNTVINILNLTEEFLIMKFPKRLNYFLDMSSYGNNIYLKNILDNIKGFENI